MKQIAKLMAAMLLALTLTLGMTACGAAGIEKTGAWETASYTADTEVGQGAKTMTLIVEADGQKITFTVHSDAETVGEALLANDLIAGDQSEFGLYVKAVNGITADYDADQTYWSFNDKDGNPLMTGVDATPFSDGDSYALVKTKG